MNSENGLTKKCQTCKETKPVSEFHSNGRQGYKPSCKPCRSKIRKQHSNGRVGKLAARKAHIKARYGITLGEWDSLFAEQGGKCAICLEVPINPHTDHCHLTGTVRGILCPDCNKGLGLFKDDIARLQAAIKYLGG